MQLVMQLVMHLATRLVLPMILHPVIDLTTDQFMSQREKQPQLTTPQTFRQDTP